MRAKPIPTVPTPLSSPSIPAEAIQAEVQRQLQGVLGQLREYGESNQRLYAELMETKAQLRAEQERNGAIETTMPPPLRLLGDLSNTLVDLEPAAGSSMNPEPRALPGDDLRRREGPAVTGGSHQGVYGSDRGAQGTTGLWGEERKHRAAGTRTCQTSSASVFDVFHGSSGLLKNWWETRGRSSSPPPKAVVPEQSSSPVPDALTKGIQQLQELQVQAMSKATSTNAVETVKPRTIAPHADAGSKGRS